MEDFKIRCSAIGHIMSQPRTKKDREAGKLSATTISYLKDWYVENQFNRRKEFTNKFTEKGLENEDEAIEIYARYIGEEFVCKNEKRVTNEWCTGEADIVSDIIVDIKSSWDLHTFPLFDEELKNKLYWWQLQGYMWLYDKPRAELAYVLTDTPPELIHKAINQAKWNLSGVLTQREEIEFEERIENELVFSDIPERMKVKIFKVERDDEAIAQIKEQVLKCRKYLEEKHYQLNNQ